MWRWEADQGGADDGRTFICSVDGTHCRIQEPRMVPDTKWYSHNFKKPALAYEVAVDLVESNIVWVNGPYKAGYPDWSIFRAPNGLQTKHRKGKKLLVTVATMVARSKCCQFCGLCNS